MKFYTTLFALFFVAVVATAQNSSKKSGTIEGIICGEPESEPLVTAAMQLYSLPDTVYVKGTASDAEGRVRLSVDAGNYMMRISYVGYMKTERNITVVPDKTLNLGNIVLRLDNVALKQAEVVAVAPPITMSEDTTVYNTSAFRVPAGSMLEDLIKKYPGVEIADDGTIKINGKTVNRILMKGKDFFGTDKEVALKNIPVDVVDKVKFYDKQSDFSRITGIDDGEEETVLDLQMKKNVNTGFFGNADVAYGTKERYSAKGLANYFTDKQQYTLVASANNVGDRGFSRGGNNSGLLAHKNGGINFATETGKLELGGHVNYRHNDSDIRSYSSTEYFMNAGMPNQYVNSRSNSFGRSTNFNGNFRLEWKPDTLTNIILTPSLSYSSSDNWSKSISATFDADPFEQDYNYLMQQFGDIPDELSDIALNSNNNETLSKSSSRSVNANLQINRRLNKPGRNITLRGGFGYGDSDSENFSLNNVRYYKESATNNGYERKRYSTTPNSNWNYNVRLSYTEPILKNLFLQLSYRFNYSYQNSDRSTYILDDVSDYSPMLGRDYHFPALPDNYETLLDDELSRHSTYRNMRHEAQLMFRYVTSKMNLSAGVTWMPQQSRMDYKYLGIDTLLKRTVYNFTPNVRMRYKWNKTTTLNVVYRGSTAQPSMTDLLDVTDDSDPLNVRQGNPGLKPSFTHRFDVRFNTNNPDAQRGIMTNLRFSNTLNSISQKVTYNEETGGRTTRPENINGNWSLDGGFGYNDAIQANKKITYSAFTTAGFNRQVSYISIDRNSSSAKNSNKTLRMGERLKFGYRNDVFDITLNGSIDYTHSDNKLQPDNNLETYIYSYGPSGNVNFPWCNMQLSTDISMSSRRGFSDPAFNTNELLWNAQLSMSFLAKNALTVTFQVYDILHEQSNVSRSINAYMRRDTRNNAINSYCMLHVIYKFNSMGSDDAKKGVPGYGNPERGMMPGPGMRGGMRGFR